MHLPSQKFIKQSIASRLIFPRVPSVLLSLFLDQWLHFFLIEQFAAINTWRSFLRGQISFHVMPYIYPRAFGFTFSTEDRVSWHAPEKRQPCADAFTFEVASSAKPPTAMRQSIGFLLYKSIAHSAGGREVPSINIHSFGRRKL